MRKLWKQQLQPAAPDSSGASNYAQQHKKAMEPTTTPDSTQKLCSQQLRPTVREDSRANDRVKPWKDMTSNKGTSDCDEKDIQLLRDTYNLQNDANLPELTVQQKDLLRHALRFPSVRAVIYYTHSVHSAENEDVVETVIRDINADHQVHLSQKQGKKFIQTEEPPQELFKVDPIPLPCEDTLDAKTMLYLKTQPSVWLEGFFMAVIKRQGDAKVPAKEVINQARAKGLLDMKTKLHSHQSAHSAVRESLCSCTDQNICEKCRSKGLFNESALLRQGISAPVKPKNPSNHNKAQSSPDSPPSSTQQIYWDSSKAVSPPSPGSPNQTRFPVLRRKEYTKRLLYPLATKTLHLPGIGPGICYPPCFSPSSSEVNTKHAL